MTKDQELTADATATIYILNKYPNDPRVKEFLEKFSLRRESAANKLPYHRTSPAIDKISGDESLWKHPSGKEITMEQAYVMARKFIEANPEMTNVTRPTPGALTKAKDQFCGLPHTP